MNIQNVKRVVVQVFLNPSG